MTGFEILIATTALLALPSVASRWRIKPRPLALAAVWSVALAAVLVLTTLSMCAAALIGRLDSSDANGMSPRHLIPALPFIGWISLGIITLTVSSGTRALFTALRRRRAMTDQLRYVDVTHISEVPVVTLPTDDFVASAVPGPHGCVVMSRGAIRRLSVQELMAVVRHEDAHRRLGHHRQLLLARAAERSLWFVPGMRRATRTLRDSLEIAADADASDVLGASTVSAAVAAAEQPVHSMQRRLGQLDSPAPPRSPVAGLLLGVTTVSILAIALELNWLGLGVWR